jgi:DNA invertase Pin-like site-specific DNA recombinase
VNFAIWAAVSTIAQADIDKASLAEQEAKCRAVGMSRGWVEVAGPYIVPGESRTRWVNLRDAENEIPPLHHMLEDAKRGAFQVLTLYDYNRLRDLLDPVAKTLASYGVQVFSVSQPVEPLPPEEFHPYASDSESMMRGMSQIISRWQVADLRRKYLYGVSARVRHGLPGLRVPYGYRKPAGQELDTKAVPVQVPGEVRVVLEIKEMFLRGDSYLDIAGCLTKRGVASPGGAATWGHTTIKKILANPFYTGKVFFQKNRTIRDPNSPDKPRVKRSLHPNLIAEGKHAPVYSWEEYQAILVEMRRRETMPRNNRYQFSGLLVCSVCGARLCHDHGVWRCKPKGTKLDHIGISVEEALALIPRALQKTLYDLVPAGSASSATAVTAVDVSDLERQRRRVQAAYESEVYSLEEAEQKIKAIDRQIAELRDGEASHLRKQKEQEAFLSTLEQAREILEILPAWVRGQDPKRVNQFLLRLIRQIVITPEGQIAVELRHSR